MLSQGIFSMFFLLFGLMQTIHAQLEAPPITSSASTSASFSLPVTTTPFASRTLSTTTTIQLATTPEILTSPISTVVPAQQGLSTGAIAGITVGAAALSLMAATAGFLIYRRRRGIASAYAEGGVYAALKRGVLSKKEIAEANLRANEPWATSSMAEFDRPETTGMAVNERR